MTAAKSLQAKKKIPDKFIIKKISDLLSIIILAVYLNGYVHRETLACPILFLQFKIWLNKFEDVPTDWNPL